MSRILFFLILFSFAFSCSLWEGAETVSLKRQLASLPPLQDVESFEDDDYITIKGTVRVYGQRYGYNTFSFPLHSLQSPFYEPVPYEVHISDYNVKCIHSDNIKRLGETNSFRIENYQYGDYLSCSYTEMGESFFNFFYKLPVMKTFEVSEAEYMKGFTPDIVSNMQLRLAKIYEKLSPSDGSKPQQLYYRERELLLKYIPDVVKLEFDPKKFEIQFETEIQDQDMFYIHDIAGEVNHNKLGRASYEGYATEDYEKYSGAGSKYLVSHGVKPYAFFCSHNKINYDFDYNNDLTFSDAGKIKCSINSRKANLFVFKPARGKISAEINILRISKAKKLLPEYYLNEAKSAIKREIGKMNKKNLNSFELRIKKKINQHEKDIVDMLSVDKTFPYRIQVIAQEKKKVLFHKPILRLETEKGKDYRYLNYRVFVKTIYQDEEQHEFQSSDLYLGEVKTDLTVPSGQSSNDYIKNYEVNSEDFNKKGEALIKKYTGSSVVVSYFKYRSILKKMASDYKRAPRMAPKKTIELSRFSLNVCGNITPFYNAQRKKVELVHLTNVKAMYDLDKGVSTSSYRTMYAKNYYTKTEKLDPIVNVATPVPYTAESIIDEQQCYYLTPGEFSNQSFEEAVILRSI